MVFVPGATWITALLSDASNLTSSRSFQHSKIFSTLHACTTSSGSMQTHEDACQLSFVWCVCVCVHACVAEELGSACVHTDTEQ
jgi:hypothetical protein